MEDDADIVAEAEAIARAAHEAIARNDLDALRALLDESVVWHATGEDDFAGTYRGREAVIAALAAQQGRASGIQLLEVDAEAEPEVVGFAFTTLGGSATVVSTTSESQCDGSVRTTGLIVVQQAKIMELGTFGIR